MLISILLALAAGGVGGFYAGNLYRKKAYESRMASAEELSRKLLENAKQEAENIRKEAKILAKDEIFKAQTEFEQESKERRAELQRMEKRLLQKEENLDKKIDLLDKREFEASKKEKRAFKLEKTVEEKLIQLQKMQEEARVKLERIAGISKEEAKNLLMDSLIEEVKHESARQIKQIEERTKEIADKKAKEILALAIQRYGGDYVAERTVSIVNLPNDEMKGRIIGREGRNIRALEAITGVDLIIDDTPEAVILSAHNPLRREVAKISLERLISDGRIHPARIEEVVKKVEEEMEETIREIGEQATFDVGVHGIHLELIKLLGRLKYRTSFGQNVLQHSIEGAFLCGIMAAELGLDVKEAKRAALLHDIGKAVDHEVEGSHAIIGADLARKYGESETIINAIAAHHEEVRPESVLPLLVQAADALSGARPGARKEMLETYVKRLEDLERISSSFAGVEKSYAIQAGREIRIIVENAVVSDDDAVVLCRDIARKIESELSYPGQIKVTVIRETRAVEYAK
ncbi:MAG: ribonuclease Y [bacterium]